MPHYTLYSMEFKLIIKKLNNSLTKDEQIVFEQWYNQSKLHRDYFNRVCNNISNNNVTNIDLEKEWKQLEKTITKKSRSRKYFQYSAAASILLLVSLAFFSNFNKAIEPQVVEPVIANTPIEIGSDKATLTLENGTQVVLEESPNYTNENVSNTGKKIVYNSKTVTGYKPKVEYNYLTIPRGGEYLLVLEDGTQVWLNSESQLKYPVSFVRGEKRVVELLYGEAYFDVSPATQHKGAKFVVKSGVQEIEVLGTEFNIKSYQDEDFTYTTLAEGKVAVKYKERSGMLLETLVPGEQLVFNKVNSDYMVLQVDVAIETAWKKGLFRFKNKPLKDIAKVLERWYNVDILFFNKEIENVRFKGSLKKNQNLEQILESIKNTKYINAYEINNNTIIIK